MSGCCATHRLSVPACIERGLATRRAAPLVHEGPRVEADGLWAAFSLRRDGDRLTLRFRAAACTTLIAYCQALVELLAGGDPAEAAAMDPATLAAALPGVPAARRDRAVLAVAALRAALASAEETPVCKQNEHREYAG